MITYSYVTGYRAWSGNVENETYYHVSSQKHIWAVDIKINSKFTTNCFSLKHLLSLSDIDDLHAKSLGGAGHFTGY